jgi:2-polyprenyl-6-methoxyphenol hydroxylase-like FAD-dependent oxidoreductase
MAQKSIGRRAIVVGAGMGGLAAAATLARHFEEVVILERDALPGKAAHRAGTPQCRHVHVILGGGQRALGELLAGFAQDLAAGGAIPLRISSDIRLELPGGDAYPQRDFGFDTYSMSRPLIEAVVRQRVQRLANVVLREHCRVRRFVATADSNTVTAVGFDSIDRDGEQLAADLIVDASGRGGLTDALLEETRRQRAAESSIGVDIGYATAIFDMPDDRAGDWKGLLTLPQAPENSRATVMMPIEGARWIVTVAGRYDQKPADSDGFLEFAQALPTPTLYDAIRRARRIGKVARFGFPASVWRHYERLAAFPRGLLPFGDAICRFNPIFGQGMTVAAQEAVLLDRLLGAEDDDPMAGLAAKFFAGAAELIETPWQQAAVPDFAMPQTNGERPTDLERRLKFGRALARLAMQDAEVHRVLIEVRHLLKPANALRERELVARVEALMAEA